MAPVERHPWDKNVLAGAVGVGLVPFLQNHDHILRVVVYKVYLEVGGNSCLSPAALDWSLYCHRHMWKRYLVHLQVRRGGGVCPLKSLS